MRYFFIIIIFFNILFIKLSYSLESFIVLKVNNNIITNLDIDHEYRYLIALNNSLKDVEKKKIMNLAKNSIIREKIKETELSKYFDMDQPNKYIDKILKNFYAELGLNNKAEFKKYLLSYNLLFSDVEKKISIETAWNDLIYDKFINEIEIDELKIKKKIKKEISDNKYQNFYLLSEILFETDKIEDVKSKLKLIEKSISEVGFKNTANIYSISDNAKLGGQIGWINENQLSKNIKDILNNMEKGEYTQPLTVPGGLLILKIDDQKKEEVAFDLNKEFNKRIAFEKNQQLNRFSKIYFNKVKKNSTISD